MKGSEKRKRYPGEQKFPLWELHRYNVPQSAPNFSPLGDEIKRKVRERPCALPKSQCFVCFVFVLLVITVTKRNISADVSWTFVAHYELEFFISLNK